MQREPHIVTTCPESCAVTPARYLDTVGEVARRSEAAGHHGLLIHSDHRLLDSWVVAQAVLAATRRLRPVITLRPLDLHPYTAARKVCSLATLFGRGPDLVLAAGGFRTDLLALDDHDSHDQRYRRLVEYGSILTRLLSSEEPLAHEGQAYRLYKPRALPIPAPEHRPEIFVAASSEAGRAAAAELGAHGVVPLLPDASLEAGAGIRVGIVARPDAEVATHLARARFPERPGQNLEHRLEMKWADSKWQHVLDGSAGSVVSPYWLEPFAHRHAQAPYLVGDYRSVARALLPAFEAGCQWLFLDSPRDDEDLEHAHEAIRRAWKRAASPLAVSR